MSDLNSNSRYVFGQSISCPLCGATRALRATRTIGRFGAHVSRRYRCPVCRHTFISEMSPIAPGPEIRIPNMKSTLDVSPLGMVCQDLQASARDVLRAASALKMKPAASIARVPYFNPDQVAQLRKRLKKRQPKEAVARVPSLDELAEAMASLD